MVAYYYPPLGGIGALRPLQFSRYLPEYGWRSSILSVANDTHYLRDESLLKMLPHNQVIIRAYRLPVFQTINRFAKRGLRNYPLAYSFLDPMFDWVPDAINQGKKFLRKKRFNALFPTIPPYSAVRIAVALKKQFNIPIVLDMRDPFVINIINWPTPLHKKFYELYWKKLLLKVDRAIVLAEFVAENLVENLKLDHLSPILIPNGYDPADFEESSEVPPRNKFVLGYVGSLYGGMSPTPLFESLELAFKKIPSMRTDIEVSLMGSMNKDEILSSASKHGVRDVVQLHGQQPHNIAISFMKRCHVLLLFTGMVYRSASGKIFEYAATGRPVLSFGIHDYTREFIEQNGFGYSVDGRIPQNGSDTIIELYNLWKRGKPIPGPTKENYGRYSRRHLTKDLAVLLDEVIR
jgi:glycosyltransferase involved in cell wall biosynthesis